MFGNRDGFKVVPRHVFNCCITQPAHLIDSGKLFSDTDAPAILGIVGAQSVAKVNDRFSVSSDRPEKCSPSAFLKVFLIAREL
jgi:hypothetical protein